MVTVKYNGGLGNNLIQHLAGYFFSIKHNLKFNHAYHTFEDLIKYDDYIEGDIGEEIVVINDDNFITYLEKNNMEIKHYIFEGFFQTKDFLEKYENEIKSLLNIVYSEVEGNSVFLHYRIGDIQDTQLMLPIEYYEDALSNINYDSGYISSDTINHENCLKLMSKYNLTPINSSPMGIINYGKNFKNLILSEGTFSWWIGFLSDNSNIVCNDREGKWFGDIFFDRWGKLSWDYSVNEIVENTQLTNYNPINLLKK